MNKKGILVFVLSLVFFMLAITSLTTTFNKSVNASSSVGSFDGVYNKGHDKVINVKEDTDLKFKVSSNVEKGDMTFQIISPDNEVIYEKGGKTFFDIRTIPVTKGEWKVNFKTNYAENGNYHFRAVIDYNRQ